MILVVEVREPSIVDRLMREDFRTDDLGLPSRILGMGQSKVN